MPLDAGVAISKMIFEKTCGYFKQKEKDPVS
jgi:hypothetical protein